VAELGTTPLAWLTAERVALACRLLERANRTSTVSPAPADWGSGSSDEKSGVKNLWQIAAHYLP
jgi:hypothetical protein